MRVLSLILTLLPLLAVQDSARPPLRLKPGDTVLVTTPYGGEFTVQTDGAVYGRGFRAVLEGKTLAQAQAEMRRAMREFVPEDDVFVTLNNAHAEVVFVIGLGGGKGPVPLRTDLTLRQVLAGAELGTDADRVEARLFRLGQVVTTVNVAALLSGDRGVKDESLQADDVVALSPVAFVRVWVLGQVASPGEIKLPEGADLYQAVAAAGGYRSIEADQSAVQASEVEVTVRRGPDVRKFPLVSNEGSDRFVLQSGDTLSVVAPEAVRVTVLGEVGRPGEFVLRGNTGLLAALAAAGGPNGVGTIENVLVFREGEMLQIDATQRPEPFQTEQGDVVYVQRNERAYFVMGEVKGAGRYLIKDGEAPRVLDALAAAGGLASKGTMRRVYLARPGPDGKIVVQRFNFDDYLKGGDPGSNPEVRPGDSLLFGQPKGITLGSVAQAMSAALLLNNLVGG